MENRTFSCNSIFHQCIIALLCHYAALFTIKIKFYFQPFSWNQSSSFYLLLLCNFSTFAITPLKLFSSVLIMQSKWKKKKSVNNKIRHSLCQKKKLKSRLYSALDTLSGTSKKKGIHNWIQITFRFLMNGQCYCVSVFNLLPYESAAVFSFFLSFPFALAIPSDFIYFLFITCCFLVTLKMTFTFTFISL